MSVRKTRKRYYINKRKRKSNKRKRKSNKRKRKSNTRKFNLVGGAVDQRFVDKKVIMSALWTAEIIVKSNLVEIIKQRHQWLGEVFDGMDQNGGSSDDTFVRNLVTKITQSGTPPIDLILPFNQGGNKEHVYVSVVNAIELYADLMFINKIADINNPNVAVIVRLCNIINKAIFKLNDGDILISKDPVLTNIRKEAKSVSPSAINEATHKTSLEATIRALYDI
jgi:hypothetical protein